MKHRGKKYKEKSKALQTVSLCSPEEAVKLVKSSTFAKFDETIDLAVVLGVDTKKGEQIRGSVVLPAGVGKSVNVAVVAKDEKADEARAAGADIVGADDIIEKIKGGWLGFDVLLATPDMMASLAKLGKTLGTKGLMPNPKSGTVAMDIGRAIKEFKSGKIEFRSDKAGVIHMKLGKVSFEDANILKNMTKVFEAINKAKPASVKGVYLKSVTLSSTMGPGIKVDPKRLSA